MPECKGCDATIEWILIDGKRIPLDTRKHPIYVLRRGAWWRELNARISHFATCPAASTFSKQANQRRETRVSKPKDTDHA